MSIRSNVDPRSMDQRVTIQRRTVTQNATTGHPATTWAALVTCWAKADAVKVSDRHKEPHIADATRAVTGMTFWLRADIKTRFALTSADRILWGADVWDIEDILDQQLRGRMVAVICQKGERDGG